MSIKPIEKQDINSAISEYISLINEDEKFKKSTLKYIEGKQKTISKFIQAGKSSKNGPGYTLTVLRKWNSFTPVLPNNKESFANKGGGYFLKIIDYGIVVDPGFNFIENFMNSGFKLDDIDSVFISHAHNDHTVELESIFSLLFKRNDECLDGNFKKIKLYVNLGTFKKFSGYFDLSNPSDKYYIEDIVILNKHQVLKLNEHVNVFITDAKHHEMISRDYAIGFIFEILKNNIKIRTINFTCDTGWNTKLQNINKKYAVESLRKVDDDNGDIDILIAHIGSIKEKEFNYDCNKALDSNQEFLYTNHLGMIGCLASIFFWRPSLVLLSEFGQEMDAIREDIANMFGKVSKRDIIAADINLTIDLENLNIMCFKDKRFYPFKSIKTYSKDGQLYYVNPDNLDTIETREIDRMLGKEIRIFDNEG